MSSNHHIQAVIWDYDGTLADTSQKNLAVTREIVETITGTNHTEYPTLLDVTTYSEANRRSTNWREFYKSEFSIGEDQVDLAGELWTKFQLSDETESPIFDGISEVLSELDNFGHGIVSQNSRCRIMKTLEVNNLINHFGSIVGYEEVEIRRQKPYPDGILRCITELVGNGHGKVFYVGDHETDVQCSRNAGAALKEAGMEVLSIAATYASETDTSRWKSKPDYEIRVPRDLLGIVSRH